MKKSISIIIISVFVTIACKNEEKKVEMIMSDIPAYPHIYLTPSQLKLMDIELTPLDKKLIYPIIYASGVVSAKPNYEATVIPRISGMVDKIFVLEGSNVTKGQILMSVSSAELIEMQQDYMASVVDVQLQEKEFDRQTSLKNAKVGALAEFQVSESRYLNALTMEKTLSSKLKLQGINSENIKDPHLARIKSEKMLVSPINGFIYNLPAKVGMRAETGTVLAEIIDLSELRADIYCYEKDLAYVSEGQEVEIQFINKAIPNVTGKIENISRTIDKETRSIVMHTSFKAPKGFLVMPEMSITAKIKGLNLGKMSETVPLTSIFEDGDQSFVYYTIKTDTSGKYMFRKAKVKTGTNDGKMVEMTFEESVPKNCKIACSNIVNLETEFKKQDSSK